MRVRHLVFLAVVGGSLALPLWLEFAPWRGFHSGSVSLLFVLVALVLVLLNFSVFLLSLFELDKAKDAAARGNSTGWILTTSATLLCFVMTTSAASEYCSGLPTGSCAETFDAPRWNSVPDGHIPVSGQRAFMLGDLVRRVLPGLTRPQVVALLGYSERTFCQDLPGKLSFLVGSSRSWLLPLGMECLSVAFDLDDRFLEARLLQSD